MEGIQKIIDGKIDFQGQRLADRIGQETIALFAAMGFLAGYSTESLQLTMLIYGAGVVLALIASVPPWPIYNKHPTTWLPNRPKPSTAAAANKSSAVAGAK
ncbi:hypothetical protein V8E36_008770 [Tilletia maclaganii]